MNKLKSKVIPNKRNTFENIGLENIGVWVSAKELTDDLKKKFYLMPRGTTFMPTYKGRMLSKQGAWFRRLINENPEDYPYLRNEEYQDDLCRWLIDIAQKATLTADSTGTYLIPTEIEPELFLLARNISFALKYCTVYPMSSIRKDVPKEATKFSVAWFAEGEQETGNEGTFGQAALQAKELVTLTARRLSGIATVSTEMLEDSAIDISSILSEAFLYAIAQELDNQMLNGDGTLVSGLLTAACENSVILTGTEFSTVLSTDLSLAISKLEEGYLRGARFVLNRMAHHYVRNIKDVNLRPIFTAGNMGVQGAIDVFGFPAEISEQISTIDGTGKPFGVFGNFKSFIIGQHTGTEIWINPYRLFDQYQIQFKFNSKFGFAYGDNNTFCRILNK